jgi:chromate reductase, NAD(P)H dehydrogenase (quinone)
VEHPAPTISLDPVIILAISGSLRAHSSNTEVLRAASLLAPQAVKLRLFAGLGDLPHFNPDLDTPGTALPAQVTALRNEFANADGLLFCSPEYAHGVPGSLKNGLDWLVSGVEVYEKPVVLLNASPRSTHAQASLAETLRTMGAKLVTAEAVVIPLAGRGLDAEAIVGDPTLAGPIKTALDALTAAIRHTNTEAEGLSHVLSEAKEAE